MKDAYLYLTPSGLGSSPLMSGCERTRLRIRSLMSAYRRVPCRCLAAMEQPEKRLSDGRSERFRRFLFLILIGSGAIDDDAADAAVADAAVDDADAFSETCRRDECRVGSAGGARGLRTGAFLVRACEIGSIPRSISIWLLRFMFSSRCFSYSDKSSSLMPVCLDCTFFSRNTQQVHFVRRRLARRDLGAYQAFFLVRHRKTMLQSADVLLPIAKAAWDGENARGNGGVVVRSYKDGIRYSLVHELPFDEMRESIEDMLTEEGDQFVFVLQEEEKTLHVWKLPRTKVVELMSEASKA